MQHCPRNSVLPSCATQVVMFTGEIINIEPRDGNKNSINVFEIQTVS